MPEREKLARRPVPRDGRLPDPVRHLQGFSGLQGGIDLRVEHARLDIDCRAEGIGKVLGVV